MNLKDEEELKNEFLECMKDKELTTIYDILAQQLNACLSGAKYLNQREKDIATENLYGLWFELTIQDIEYLDEQGEL